MLVLVVRLLVLEVGAVCVAVGSGTTTATTTDAAVVVVGVVQCGRGRRRAVRQRTVAQDWGGCSTGGATHETTAVVLHVQAHEVTIDVVGARRQNRSKGRRA